MLRSFGVAYGEASYVYRTDAADVWKCVLRGLLKCEIDGLGALGGHTAHLKCEYGALRLHTSRTFENHTFMNRPDRV